jgi:hypothetical protein
MPPGAALGVVHPDMFAFGLAYHPGRESLGPTAVLAQAPWATPLGVPHDRTWLQRADREWDQLRLPRLRHSAIPRALRRRGALASRAADAEALLRCSLDLLALDTLPAGAPDGESEMRAWVTASQNTSPSRAWPSDLRRFWTRLTPREWCGCSIVSARPVPRRARTRQASLRKATKPATQRIDRANPRRRTPRSATVGPFLYGEEVTGRPRLGGRHAEGGESPGSATRPPDRRLHVGGPRWPSRPGAHHALPGAMRE